MIARLPGCTARLATRPVPELAPLKSCLIDPEDMPHYYDSLLALVVPGRTDSASGFVRKKMRCNFFSTKATEALTRGVPLVVSSELHELAEFVKRHHCGAVYDPRASHFSFPDGDWLTDKSAWERMTNNAVAIGETFTRAAVLDRYLETWQTLARRAEDPAVPGAG
jgi:glycosyltransferase involved in cell wall biosynthesis